MERQISQLGNPGDEKNTNKRERQQEEGDCSSSRKRSNRKQHKEGGNAKERRDIRNNKVKKGCTHVTSRDENFTDMLSVRPIQETSNLGIFLMCGLIICLNWYVVGHSTNISLKHDENQLPPLIVVS